MWAPNMHSAPKYPTRLGINYQLPAIAMRRRRWIGSAPQRPQRTRDKDMEHGEWQLAPCSRAPSSRVSCSSRSVHFVLSVDFRRRIYRSPYT